MNKRLSSPVENLGSNYDVIVIGSGYGGGVAASRLSRAGRRVCVIERGKELRPGDYPETMDKAGREVQVDTPEKHLGNPTGLFDVRTNPDLNVLVGCGLGGTSLINANVALEVKKELFKNRCWPKEFRDDEGILDKFYARAKIVLGSNSYPDEFPKLAKVESLKFAAVQMGVGEHFRKPPLNITFKEKYNYAGVKQAACNMCGDCVTGCNVGAKNTTLMNYLPDAVNHGAKIFCELEAYDIKKTDQGWSVTVRSKQSGREFSKVVSGNILIMAAGTLGTTELLMRSRNSGLNLSSQLGKRFSGNGDVYGHGYDTYSALNTDVSDKGIVETAKSLIEKIQKSDKKTKAKPLYSNGVGSLKVARSKRPGPCIAGMIDLRDEDKPVEERLVIQEGVIPRVLAKDIEPTLFFRNATESNLFKFGGLNLASRLEDAEIAAKKLLNNDLSSDPYSGVMSRTSTYLAMGHDKSNGELRLDSKGKIRVDWKQAGRDPAVVHDNSILEKMCDGVQAHYLPNPLWNEASGWKLLTVHPVGGCAMGDCAESGVVNHACQVFDSTTGTSVHEGLYICDGSVIPESIGVNPLLTITAIAERACELICKMKSWDIEYSPSKPRKEYGILSQTSSGAIEPLLQKVRFKAKRTMERVDRRVKDIGTFFLQKLIHRYPYALSPSLEFSETMRGHLTTDIQGIGSSNEIILSDKYRVGAYRGKLAGQEVIGVFSVAIENIEKMLRDPNHSALLSGHILYKPLSAEKMSIENGRFHLFQEDSENIATWIMLYEGVLKSSRGEKLLLRGSKELKNMNGSHWITDTTNLSVDIYKNIEGTNVKVAMGKMKLEIDELVNQISSLKIGAEFSPMLTFLQRRAPEVYKGISAISISSFVGLFGRTVVESYGGLLSNLGDFSTKKNLVAAKTRRRLNAPQPTIYTSHNESSGQYKLTRFKGGDRGPIVLAPGFSVKASSYTTTTVEENLVEYLTKEKFDVWLFDYRASPDSGHSTTSFTIDDIATKDWFGAIEKVKTVSEKGEVQVIAHCVGAMTLLMAICEGLTGIRHAIISQLSIHPVTNWLNYLKSDLDIINLLKREGFTSLNLNTSDDKEEKILDTLLWNVPVPKGQHCTNPVCRRIFSIFGASYAHENLNEETHNALCEMFGEISLKPFEQLSKIIDKGEVVDAFGRDRYLSNIDRLNLPLDFIAGERNEIFDPESSKRTCELLESLHGSKLYSRRVFPRYAHMDFFIGRNANKDIFPYLLKKLEDNEVQ